jgi:phosphoglucosamine mutase
VRKIKARLFYVGDDGTRLTSVERDVPFADQTVAQARRIVEAQLAPVEAPLVSAIPSGTTVRAVFLTEQGAAFVDLSREVSAAHPGGSINELLTIYTIVQALTTNLPAVTSVQLLDVVKRTGRTLADLASVMTRLPQVLRNVRVASAAIADLDVRIASDIEAARASLGEHGRVLVRRSGTEPLVRVMVEAPTVEEADAVAERLAEAVSFAAS